MHEETGKSNNQPAVSYTAVVPIQSEALTAYVFHTSERQILLLNMSDLLSFLVYTASYIRALFCSSAASFSHITKLGPYADRKASL